jgi:hypothetical protein
MSLFPDHFTLSMERPEEKDLVPGVEAVCVVSTDQVFTEQVQAKIKFAISSKFQGKKQRVPLRQDLCGMSGDHDNFRIGFSLTQPGLYKVIVKLGDTHVVNSPLQFNVAAKDEDIKNKPAPDILEMETTRVLAKLVNNPTVPDLKTDDTTSGINLYKRTVHLQSQVPGMDMNTNQNLAVSDGLTICSPISLSRSEAFFVTPEQSFEVEEEERRLEDPDHQLQELLDECEVAKEVGLVIALALLKAEIDKVKGGVEIPGITPKIDPGVSMSKQEKLPPKVIKATPQPQVSLIPTVLRHSQNMSVPHLPKSADSIVLLGPRNFPLVPHTSQAKPRPVLPSTVSSGLLDLTKSPAKLSSVKILSIPMCRDQGKEPDRSLHAPIGMCLLKNGEIVVASTFSDKVKMFCPAGNFLRLVTPVGMGFCRPSDMVCLRNGDFVVRDDNRLRLFSSQGSFISSIWEDRSATKCFGLAEDDEGRLVSIKKSGLETDLLFFDMEAEKIVKRMSLEDIISDKMKSKCRFLAFHGGNLYITDLGMDQVYVIDSKSHDVILKFGETGSGPGCLDDPAGLGIDSVGNMVVADSKNHRLCVYSAQGSFLRQLHLPDVRRPSGLLLLPHSRSLFVLNLGGLQALVKYRLGD